MRKPITEAQLNAFVGPSIEVLEKLARISTEVGTLRRQRWSIPLERFVIAVGVEGDLNGQVVFLFDPPVLERILTAMLGSPRPPLTDPICCDALGEVANIIAGNATGRMESLGLRITITPPQILTWKEVNRGITDNEGIVIPLKSAWGEIGISLFIEKI